MTKKKLKAVSEHPYLITIQEAKLTNTFNFHFLRRLFDDKSFDELKEFEDSLTADQTLELACDCESANYTYIGTAKFGNAIDAQAEA